MRLKAIQAPKNKRLVIKLSEHELQEIEQRAQLYAEGNVSLWVRFASMNLKPRAEDLDFGK